MIPSGFLSWCAISAANLPVACNCSWRSRNSRDSSSARRGGIADGVSNDQHEKDPVKRTFKFGDDGEGREEKGVDQTINKDDFLDGGQGELAHADHQGGVGAIDQEVN